MNTSNNCPVLFVEDSRSFRETVIHRYLKQCTVTMLESGKRFRAELDENDFHFILMDYQLAGEYSGEDLVMIAREAGYDGAIIGVSSSEYLNHKLLRAGADVVLTKRERYLLPKVIRQGLSLAEARGNEIRCEYGQESRSSTGSE